jgi:hypothetical protein
VTGGYTVPLVGIRSHHPCTALFAILVLEILRRVVASRRVRGVRLRDSDVFLFLLRSLRTFAGVARGTLSGRASFRSPFCRTATSTSTSIATRFSHRSGRAATNERDTR